MTNRIFLHCQTASVVASGHLLERKAESLRSSRWQDCFVGCATKSTGMPDFHKIASRKKQVTSVELPIGCIYLMKCRDIRSCSALRWSRCRMVPRGIKKNAAVCAELPAFAKDDKGAPSFSGIEYSKAVVIVVPHNFKHHLQQIWCASP